EFEFIRCSHCSTEFRVVIDKAETRKLAYTRITVWVNAGAWEPSYDTQWRLAASCHSASLHASYSISPEDSLYLSHFDRR
ncbi:hypothetical protein EMCG_04625, partial [[Emmonsia] crescens]